MANTANLGLTLPTVGADLDTWGDENNAIITAFDAALATLISGLTLSTAGSSSTFGVAAGSASGMTLTSAYTKTTGAWGVGTGNGALDTGTIANATWYHVWLIQRPDTGVVDLLVSTSVTTPTLPTNYTRKRRIGSMLTDGSAKWTKFTQLGRTFLWTTPVRDYASIATVNSAVSKGLTVPSGVQVEALLDVELDYSSNSTALYISALEQDDAVAGAAGFTAQVTPTMTLCTVPKQVRTNTSAQVRFRSNSSGGLVFISTNGWIDARGSEG